MTESRTTRRDRPSVRRLALLMTTAFGSLALLVIVVLIYSTTMLQRATTTAIRQSHGVETASQIELSLLIYQRLGNVYLLTGEEELATARLQLREEIDALSARASDYIEGPLERQVHAEVVDRLASYFSARARLEEQLVADMEEVSRRSQEPLRQAVDRLELLRDLNEDQVAKAHARAMELDRRSTIFGAGAGLFLALGLVGAFAGVRRYVVRPTLALHETVSAFRAGDRDRRASEAGSRESAELARAFNDLADELGRQRQSQLEFLAGVAHDLRNPLGALKLGIHALAVEQSESQRMRTLERLDRQGDRLARMVNDLLDATRIEAGQLELDIEEIDAREVVTDIVRLYAPTSPDHDIVRDLPPEPVMVRADSLRLEQVLSNLLSNAIKFSPGGGAIAIKLEAHGGSAVMSVRDQGIGISAAALATIFMPFRRRRPDVAPGAGLGLSVVRRIVTAHGGDIEAESEPGEGTTFRVTLPLVQAAQVDARAAK